MPQPTAFTARRRHICTATLLLCVLGWLGNYLSVSVMFGVDFIFGSIFAVYALLRYGSLAGIIVAAVAGSYTLILWGHPYAMLVFVIELCTLALLLRRVTNNTVVAVTGFWLLLGIPASLLLYTWLLNFPLESALMVAVKQMINGVFNALMASLAVLFVERWRGKRMLDGTFATTSHTKAFRLEHAVFYPFLSVLITVGAIPILWESFHTRDLLEAELKNRMQERAQQALQASSTGESTLWQGELLGWGRYAVAVVDPTVVDNTKGVVVGEQLLVSAEADVEPLSSNDDQYVILLPLLDLPTMPRWKQGVYQLTLVMSREELLAGGWSQDTRLVIQVAAATMIHKLEVERLYKFIGLFMLLIASLVIARVITKMVLNPLQRLLKASNDLPNQLAEGRSVTIPESRIEEFQSLGKGLHTMADQLLQNKLQEQSYQQRLEQDVERRTRELHQANDFLKSLLASASELSIIATDVNGLITHFSTGAEKLLGYRADEMVHQQTPIILHSPEEVMTRGNHLTHELGYDVSGFDVFVARAKQGQAETRRWTYIDKQGRPIPVRLSVTAIKDENAQPIGFLGVGTDIRAELEAQKQLQESNQQLELIIQSTQVGIWDWHIPSGTVIFNERWAKIVGYSLDELAPINIDTWLSLCHPNDVKKSEEKLKAHWNGATDSYEIEVRMRHKDGHWVWVFSTGCVVNWGDDGCPLRMVGTDLDITERKNNERELIKLSQVASQTTSGIVVTGVDGRIEWVNQSFEKITGYSLPEIIGLRPGEFLLGEDTDPSAIEAVRNGLRLEQDFTLDILNYNKQKKPYWVNINCNPLRDKDGHLLGFMAIQNDITDNKKVQNELLKAKLTAEYALKVKSEFLASMSHEIRTPMNGVVGMLNLLLKDDLNDNQKRKALLAQSSAKSLLSLINDILDFSKVEADKIELENIDFDLRSMLDDCIESLAIRAQDNSVKLMLDSSTIGVSSINGDPSRLRQILTNLISNSIKFTHQGDVIVRCHIHPVGDNEYIFYGSVSDTGIGIERSKFDSLFESFTQVDASTTREYGGTGLGLAIVKRLCILMGGSVAVASELGKGSCFEFSVLLQQAQSSVVTESPSMSGQRWLILEEHLQHLDTLHRQLSGWGADVTKLETRLQLDDFIHACNQSTTQSPVTGIMITVGDSAADEALCQQLRTQQELKYCRIVAMVSMEDTRDRDAFIHLGFDEVVRKPLVYRDLCTATQLNTNNTSIIQGAIEADNSVEPAIAWPQDTKILLVEDNLINQEVALGLLEAYQLPVDVVDNGREALTALQVKKSAQSYTLVLMDCQMPVMDGYETTRQIRSGSAGVSNKNIPIIAMTANAMKGDDMTCIEAGMNDYLSKPIDEELLLAKLQQWLLGVDTEFCQLPNSRIHSRAVSLDNHYWDKEGALKRVRGRPDRLCKLIQMFLKDNPARLSELAKHCRQADSQHIKLLAHTVKGVAANLGLTELQLAAAELEQNHSSDHVVSLQEKVQQAFTMIEPLLQGYLEAESATD